MWSLCLWSRQCARSSPCRSTHEHQPLPFECPARSYIDMQISDPGLRFLLWRGPHEPAIGRDDLRRLQCVQCCKRVRICTRPRNLGCHSTTKLRVLAARRPRDSVDFSPRSGSVALCQDRRGWRPAIQSSTHDGHEKAHGLYIVYHPGRRPNVRKIDLALHHSLI